MLANDPVRTRDPALGRGEGASAAQSHVVEAHAFDISKRPSDAVGAREVTQDALEQDELRALLGRSVVRSEIGKSGIGFTRCEPEHAQQFAATKPSMNFSHGDLNEPRTQ